MKIPSFQGMNGPNAYLEWEKNVKLSLTTSSQDSIPCGFPPSCLQANMATPQK